MSPSSASTAGPPARAITIQVRFDVGDPVCGTVRLEGGPAESGFCGWIELMSVIAALRAAPDGTAAG